VGLFTKDYETIETIEKIPDSVLTVGRLEEKKGYRYALEAIALVRKSVPAIQYYIIGEGTLRDELVRYAGELGIADCCHFLGTLPSSEVTRYYHKCAVFMLASVTAHNGDMEGQGLVLQEAQAAGLPVVSTLHNGIPEGVLQYNGGDILVPEKDNAALAEKLVLLLRDKFLREQMGKDGKEFVRNKYDMSIIVKQLNTLYNSFTNGKNEQI